MIIWEYKMARSITVLMTMHPARPLLLTLAAYFQKHRPEHSMIFALMDSEEGSGAGGRRFVNDPPVPLRQIVMNINIDMIGRDAKNTVYAVGTYHYPFLKPYLENVARSAQVNSRFGYDVPDLKDTEDWTTESDHLSLHLSKIPFIYFGVEDFEQHHQPTDDFETIMVPFYVHVVETIIESAKAFDANLDSIASASPSRFPPGWPVLDTAGEREVLAVQNAFENAIRSRDVQRNYSDTRWGFHVDENRRTSD
jgi:Zn-dependent M28 family amino/carboxypeptidase